MDSPRGNIIANPPKSAIAIKPFTIRCCERLIAFRTADMLTVDCSSIAGEVLQDYVKKYRENLEEKQCKQLVNSFQRFLQRALFDGRPIPARALHKTKNPD